jgi:hypothetical protein
MVKMNVEPIISISGGNMWRLTPRFTPSSKSCHRKPIPGGSTEKKSGKYDIVTMPPYPNFWILMEVIYIYYLFIDLFIYLFIYIDIYIYRYFVVAYPRLGYKAYTMYFHSDCTPNSVGTWEQQHHFFVGRETAAHRQGGATLVLTNGNRDVSGL